VLELASFNPESVQMGLDGGAHLIQTIKALGSMQFARLKNLIPPRLMLGT
jgi:hypothetical protein